jgi:Tol biopolymer transport system component
MNKNSLSVFIFEEKKMKKLFLSLLVLGAFSISTAAQNYTIQQYLNIRSAVSPSLSPDGRRMAYLTNVTGTMQIWMMDLPSGAPKQITNYDDNVGFVQWSPAGNGLIFGKARGGDENTQLFLMANDGFGIKELTSDPKVRHNFGDWSKDGKRIYYASNTVTTSTFIRWKSRREKKSLSCSKTAATASPPSPTPAGRLSSRAAERS